MRGTANRITFFRAAWRAGRRCRKGPANAPDRYPIVGCKFFPGSGSRRTAIWRAKDLRIAEDFRGFWSRASSALPFGYIRSPNTGRIRVPTPFPINAAANHNQPCTLEEAMPLKYAPILQPYAIRAP